MMINSAVYAEVFEILKYMDKTDVMKIPVEILTKIKDYKDDNYILKIDKNDVFNRANVMPETIKYIAWLDVNFWESKDEKERLKKKYIEKKNKEEMIKRQIYKVNGIFDNKNNEIEDSNIQMITTHKETFLVKIKKLIKEIFK